MIVSVGVGGCSADDDGFEAFVARERACGLVGDGRPSAPLDAPEADCYYDCVAEGSCGELEDIFCGGGTESALDMRCVRRCAFTCDSGAQIELFERCDTHYDCDDGSDEDGCGDWIVDCGDGDQIPRSYACDGQVDCYDGRDEEGCELFDCGGALGIPKALVCNGDDDCDDGRDEDGCALIDC
jgi:hypothetical protein